MHLYVLKENCDCGESSSDRRNSEKGGYSMDGLDSQISLSHPYKVYLGWSQEDNCNSQSTSENSPKLEN
ncbi:hypothetical protein TNCV_2751461 [Trichonephila clavipes]|nr:hypothetical protein TNCV_2751461 [Trichonephila clavipes]